MLPLIVSFQGKHNFSYENFNMNKKGFGYAKNIVSTVMLCFRVEECEHTGLVWLTLPLGRVYMCVCVCCGIGAGIVGRLHAQPHL